MRIWTVLVVRESRRICTRRYISALFRRRDSQFASLGSWCRLNVRFCYIFGLLPLEYRPGSHRRRAWWSIFGILGLLHGLELKRRRCWHRDFFWNMPLLLWLILPSWRAGSSCARFFESHWGALCDPRLVGTLWPGGSWLRGYILMRGLLVFVVLVAELPKPLHCDLLVDELSGRWIVDSIWRLRIHRPRWCMRDHSTTRLRAHTATRQP